MSYQGNIPASNFESPKKDRFTGISGTTCSLTYAVSSVADIIVWVNSVKQDFTNYSDEILQTVSLFLLNIYFFNSTYPLLYPSNFLRSSSTFSVPKYSCETTFPLQLCPNVAKIYRSIDNA